MKPRIYWTRRALAHIREEMGRDITEEDLRGFLQSPYYQRRWGEGKYKLTGKVRGGRYLTLLVRKRRDGRYEVKTGWVASRAEKDSYVREVER